jgi:hypothetical protein
MGIGDKPISSGSPWQNCFAETMRLLPERGILGLKPALGREECGQQVQG